MKQLLAQEEQKLIEQNQLALVNQRKANFAKKSQSERIGKNDSIG